jgi:hypothetical protein
MIKLSHDEKRNIVTLKYEGNVDVREAKELYLKLQTLIPKCPRGFKLLADLSLVDNIKKEVLPVIKKIMDLLNQHGISEVIRIIPDPDKDIGFNILSIFHYAKDVKVLTCQSLEQAHW